MKKILFAIALTITLGFTANAQRDDFFSSNGALDDIYRSGADYENFALPEAHGTGNDYNAPLGSGLLVLTALGAGSALKKKRDE